MNSTTLGARRARAPNLFASLVAAIRRRLDARRAMFRLEEMDDHILKDMGISRGEIRSVVLGDDAMRH